MDLQVGWQVSKASIILVSLLSVGAAYAQESTDPEAGSTVEAADSDAQPATSEEASKPLPSIGGEDQLAVFTLQRGFYFSSDLGVFMTFGGVLPYSNVQPYLSMKAGFDVNDYLSVQLSLSHGYSSGNPRTDADQPGSTGQQTANYSLLNVGGEVVFAIRPTERFAIEPMLGGGLTRIYPQISDPKNPSQALGAAAPHAAFGVDFKYLTLLTDFTAGVSLTGYYIIGPNIPAAGASFVVRYTF